MQTIDNILKERGANYGEFSDFASLCQQLKELTRSINEHPALRTLSYVEREALDMILHKLVRILNGNANYLDSWVDIAGYATLVIQHLENLDIQDFNVIYYFNHCEEFFNSCQELTKFKIQRISEKTLLTCPGKTVNEIFWVVAQILTLKKSYNSLKLWKALLKITQDYIDIL